MTKEQAMSVLGLTRADGKKRPKTLADYTEDDLLEAFRAECKVVGNILPRASYGKVCSVTLGAAELRKDALKGQSHEIFYLWFFVKLNPGSTIHGLKRFCK
jgi:hypothetical protein